MIDYFNLNNLTRYTLKHLIYATSLGLLSLVACSQQQKTVVESHVHSDSLAMLYDPKIAAQKAFRLDTLLRSLQSKNGFNGTVLVAQYGKVIYSGAFGYKTITTHDTLTTQTPFQLASVSKTLTSVAVLQLVEKGILHLDDSITTLIPGFPYDGSITIRSLLTHRSGLPNYQYSLEKFYDRKRPLSNREVVEKLIAYQPKPYYLPNQKFNYNNTNFVLLAYIVERISGKSFNQYLQENIFIPLGMSHTFLYDGNDATTVLQAATGYTAGRRSLRLDYLDSVVGDKSVFSTVEDLFKFDQALCNEKLLKLSTLAGAFQPAHHDRNLITKNYGMGWRLQLLPNGEWLTFHTGWWHGFKNYYLHNPKDQSTIIVLSNVANHYLSRIYEIHAILYPEKAAYFMKEPVEGQEEAGGNRN